MQNIESGSGTEKPANKLSKSKRNLLSAGINNEIEHQQKIAISAYYKAEKRGFISSEADAMQDWLEAEQEVNNSPHNS